MRRSSHTSCTKQALSNVNNSKTGAYGMQAILWTMYITGTCGVHVFCTRQSNFSVEGINTAAYCKQHAADGMVDVQCRLFAHMHPALGNQASMSRAVIQQSCWKQHNEDNMAHVRSRRCSHDSCWTQARSNFEGSRPALCRKQHAEDGIVDTAGMRCLQSCCTDQPSFIADANTAAAYCDQNMMWAAWWTSTRSVAHTTPAITFRWGLDVLANTAPTACLLHTGGTLGTLVINFEAKSKSYVVGMYRVGDSMGSSPLTAAATVPSRRGSSALSEPVTAIAEVDAHPRVP